MAEQEGRLWVVGIGPGSYEDMTIRAARILPCRLGITVPCFRERHNK